MSTLLSFLRRRYPPRPSQQPEAPSIGVEMAGVGMFDFAWYDLAWMLIFVHWPVVVAIAVGLHAILWIVIREEAGWSASLLVVGLWGAFMAVSFACVVVGENFDGVFANLLPLLGFAVPAHFATIVIWFSSVGRGYSVPGALLRSFIYLQPFAFGVGSALLLVHFLANGTRVTQSETAPPQQNRWLVNAGETSTQLIWPVGKYPVVGRTFLVICNDSQEMSGITGKDGRIDLTGCTPGHASEIVLPPELP